MFFALVGLAIGVCLLIGNWVVTSLAKSIFLVKDNLFILLVIAGAIFLIFLFSTAPTSTLSNSHSGGYTKRYKPYK